MLPLTLLVASLAPLLGSPTRVQGRPNTMVGPAADAFQRLSCGPPADAPAGQWEAMSPPRSWCMMLNTIKLSMATMFLVLFRCARMS